MPKTYSTEVAYKSLDFLGFPKYRVGSDGSVWSRWRSPSRVAKADGQLRDVDGEWRRLSPCRNKVNGYLYYDLHESGGYESFSGHKLVLLAFVGPCPVGMQACHFPDRSPENNNLSNLRWDTVESNKADQTTHGTRMYGSRNARSKITEDDAVRIRCLRDEGYLLRELSEMYGMSQGAISRIVSRKVWRHV